VDGLRDILAAGGVMEAALIKQFEYIRLMQNNEGLTLLDSKDQFAAHQYSFSGLSDVLLQFGQQLSGACEIPLVRLFGQSPTGMNATGESDLRFYYDDINKLQNSQLNEPLLTILRVMSMSLLSKPFPEDGTIAFNPLWQMQDKEKVELAKNIGDSLNNLFNSGILKKHLVLKELKQSSRITGMFTNITDEDITEAENEPDLDMGEDEVDPLTSLPVEKEEGVASKKKVAAKEVEE
jgi:phage-related protein (TIGR01555 family)